MNSLLFVAYKCSCISLIVSNHKFKISTNICHHINMYWLYTGDPRIYLSTKIEFFYNPWKLVSVNLKVP